MMLSKTDCFYCGNREEETKWLGGFDYPMCRKCRMDRGEVSASCALCQTEWACPPGFVFGTERTLDFYPQHSVAVIRFLPPELRKSQSMKDMIGEQWTFEEATLHHCERDGPRPRKVFK